MQKDMIDYPCSGTFLGYYAQIGLVDGDPANYDRPWERPKPPKPKNPPHKEDCVCERCFNKVRPAPVANKQELKPPAKVFAKSVPPISSRNRPMDSDIKPTRWSVDV